MRRVVITGLGAISPLGHDVNTTFEHLLQAKSGIVEISKFDATLFPSRIAGEVRDLDISPFFSPKEARKVDSFIRLAVIAAHEAFADSGLDLDKCDLERFGTLIGSGIGGLPMIEQQYKVLLEKGPRRVTPFFIPSLIINLAGGQVSIKYGLKGPSSAPATACATSTHAIGDAFRLIQYGHADLMVAGGTESVVCELTMAGFGAMKALSTRNDEPHLASRPFDTARDGFVLGEGCGLMILEEYEHAVKRGAKIYAEIAGYGMSSDAYHITSPSENGDGPIRAMKNALKDAAMNPDQLQLVNAHGTSTPAGDRIEALAIAEVFGSHVGNLAVHSTKSMVGHMLGAAGGMEAVILAKTLETGKVHPTANLENVDESVKFDPLKGDARDMNITAGLSNSFGFGGTNGSLIFRKI